MNAPSNLKTIAVAAIAIVSALIFIPMMADDSDAVTDLGNFVQGTNESSEENTYSGLYAPFSELVDHDGEVFYVSLGASIGLMMDDVGAFQVDDANVFDLPKIDEHSFDGTVSCYGVTKITAGGSVWSGCTFEIVCLPPGVTDLGIYTSGSNKSSENAFYRGIDSRIGASALTEPNVANTLYVLQGAFVHIDSYDTWSGFDIVPSGFTSGKNSQGIGYIEGYVPEYGEHYISWNGEVHIEIYLVSPSPSYTVIFDSNGGSEVPNQVTDTDGIVTAPEDPVLSGYIFGGWYTEDDIPFDFSQPISEDITLHAIWIETLVFSTVPTSSGTVKAVPMMAGTIVCDASQSSDYTSILWDLGDGTTSTNTYVTHYYSQPGTYEVTLTVFNEHGTDVTTYTVEVPESSTGGGGMTTFSSTSQSDCSQPFSSQSSYCGCSDHLMGAVA